MVRPIVKDVMFLSRKSENAELADKGIIQDLKDTLTAHKSECVGMAANMIGYSKRIIIINAGIFDMIMVNPVIVKKSSPFQTEEGCLSLDGTRPTKRFKEIEVEYLDSEFRKKRGKFSEWIAQIIQHEIDHCNGIII